MSYIYIAENLKKPIEGTQKYKSYIGFTRHTIEWRFSENNTLCGHFYRAFILKNNNKFYHALRKYGKESFRIRELEYLDTDDIEILKEREIFWVKEYDSYYNGYNMTPGGDGNFRLSKESRQKISDKLKGKKWSNKRKQEFKKSINTPEYHKKRCLLSKQMWENYGDKLRASRASKEYKEKMSKISTEVRQKQEFKEKMHTIMHSKEYHDNMSKAIKQMYQNPEVRQKLSKSLKKAYESTELRQKIGDRVKEALNKPEIKEKRSKSISAALSGTKVMNNGVHIKYVKKKNVNDYLKEGWSYGRLKKERVL